MSSRPPTPPPITYVKAACHCGLNEFRAGFPTSALPISNDLCHCSSCRHSSGQMAVYHVNVVSLLCADSDEPFHVDGNDGGLSPDGDGDLIAYRTSENAVRYFCSICSAHLIFRYLGTPKEGGEEGEREGGYWCVAAGSLERTEGIVQVGYHIWVEDTLDGGLADHLRTVGDVKLPRYRRGPGSEELPVGWRAEDDRSLIGKPHNSLDDSLHFSCHCRTLQFKITRPDSQSSLPYAAFPDLLYPYDITHLAKIRNSGDVKWWLRPLGSVLPHKYFAGHCACTQCRLTSGFELQSWVYVPRTNILNDQNRPVALREHGHDDIADVREAMGRLGVSGGDRLSKLKPTGNEGHDARMEGLKQYISGPGRYREFCQKCGATAFTWQAARPDLICVAVGLVDERQAGARAESWFDWCLTRVGYAEQAVSARTVEGLTAGLREVKREKAGEGDEVESYADSPRPLTPAPTPSIKEKGRTHEVVALVGEVSVSA